MILFALMVGCLDEPARLSEPPQVVAEPVIAPQVEVPAPSIVVERATTTATSPAAVPATPEVEAARKILTWVVETFARDPADPWAIGHALLALGPDTELVDGKKAVPWLFEEYAEWHTVNGEKLVGFPRKRGNIRIEPHTDLVLKALMETGVPLDATFIVQGKPATVEQLYRYSLYKAWINPKGETGFDGLHDAPWALQGLTTAAPKGYTWMAKGGRPMSLDAMTDTLAADLDVQTRFMQEAMAKGETVEKRRQGIFAYTCGGQHTLQGVAYAVGRGFGSASARERVITQIDILYWRLDIELNIYDTMLREHPEYELPLFEQRLKFLGHFLESAHKMAAMGLYKPSEEQKEKLAKARIELVATLAALDQGGAFRQLAEMRANPDTFQMYLDFVGDSAHALRGLDLSTGRSTVTF